MHTIYLRVVLASFVLVSGCVERQKDLTAAEREQLEPFVSNEAPSPQHEVEFSFEDKIKLVGYDISVERITPNREFVVTWYWKSERALERGWQIFTHLADAEGTDRLNQDGESVVRHLHQPGRWRPGQYVKDEQHITIPSDWNSDKVIFYLGIWNGPHRLQVTEGANDGNNRARVLTLDVGPAAAGPAPTEERNDLPELPAGRAEGITIDGRLDEPAWAAARATGRLVNTMNGSPAEPRAQAKVLFDDEALYVGFEVTDTRLIAPGANRDDHHWEHDCVEVMIDPDGDARNYFELQVTPTNVTFETRYDTPRQPQPFGDVAWNPPIETRVTTRGTPNDDDDDEGYTVEMKLPWASFAVGPSPATPGRAGGMWRMNFFVMDEGEEGQQAVGWSPPRVGDFHTLARFGRVRFGPPAVQGVIPLQRPQLQVSPTQLQQIEAIPGVNPRNDPDRPREGEVVPTRPSGGGAAAPAGGGAAGEGEGRATERRARPTTPQAEPPPP